MEGQSKIPKWSVSAKKILFNRILPCLIFAFIIIFWIYFDIRSSVKDTSFRAVREYSGDKVEALISYMQSEKYSLRDRNGAVWALGQIGD